MQKQRFSRAGWPHVVVSALLFGCGAERPDENTNQETESVAEARSAIVDATSSNLRQFVLLNAYDGNTNTRELCMGVLLGPRHVLTARHCLYRNDGQVGDLAGIEVRFMNTSGAWEVLAQVPAYLQSYCDSTGINGPCPSYAPTTPYATGGKVVHSSGLPPVPIQGASLGDHDVAMLYLPMAKAISETKLYSNKMNEFCTIIPQVTEPDRVVNQIGRINGAMRDGIFASDWKLLLTESSLARTYPKAWISNAWDPDARSESDVYVWNDPGDAGDCGGGPISETTLSSGATAIELWGVYRGNVATQAIECKDPHSMRLSDQGKPECVDWNPGDHARTFARYTSLSHPAVRNWLINAMRGPSVEMSGTICTGGERCVRAVDPRGDSYYDSEDNSAGTWLDTDGFFPCCGDGVCETLKGERFANCPSDCPNPRTCREVPAFTGVRTIDPDGPVHDPNDPQKPPTSCAWTSDTSCVWSDPADPNPPSFGPYYGAGGYLGKDPPFPAYCEDGYTLVLKVDGQDPASEDWATGLPSGPNERRYQWGWSPYSHITQRSYTINPDQVDLARGTALLRGYSRVPMMEGLRIKVLGNDSDPLSSCAPPPDGNEPMLSLGGKTLDGSMATDSTLGGIGGCGSSAAFVGIPASAITWQGQPTVGWTLHGLMGPAQGRELGAQNPQIDMVYAPMLTDLFFRFAPVSRNEEAGMFVDHSFYHTVGLGTSFWYRTTWLKAEGYPDETDCKGWAGVAPFANLCYGCAASIPSAGVNGNGNNPVCLPPAYRTFEATRANLGRQVYVLVK